MMLTHEQHGLKEVSSPELFWAAMGVALVCGLVFGRVIQKKTPAAG